ncbi:MAG: hypothetical protein ACOYYF_05365 [Chloroflexota bacterium]|nr:hypothetical protein [Chloroflexota bacterium]MBI5702712.1 hypothetical protein [Chloroflexota bacterium]
MSQTKGKSEVHGCIVCGNLFQLLVAYDAEGKYIGSKVMSAGGREVKGASRPLVACDKHTDKEIERAVQRVYGGEWDEEEN